MTAVHRHIVAHSIEACTEILLALASSIECPEEIAPDYRLLLRDLTHFLILDSADEGGGIYLATRTTTSPKMGPHRMAAKAEANVQGRDVYLVGSVPMASPQEVFETVSAALGTKVKRIPDGETGDRGDWITWLEPVFANNPAFEKSGKFFRVHATGTGRERYTLKQGIASKDVRFGNLFYADIAQKSYAEFKRLKDAGKIPSATKFQVDLVPAHSVIWLFLVDELHAPLDAIYNEAVKREIDKIAADIPHHELAIQFDVASAVFARLERNEASSYGRSKSEMQDAFSNIVIDLGNRVPSDIDLLYHLCYGDSNHRHVVEPTDMGDMVEFANRVAKRISRPIQLIHMPVPRNRTDDAYFAPLKRLDLRPETELCLGLVHYTDGVAGSEKRLSVAKKFRAKFSIATECGFGRRDPATIHDLLRIHSEVAELD